MKLILFEVIRLVISIHDCHIKPDKIFSLTLKMAHKVAIKPLDKDGKICFFLKSTSNISKSCDKEKVHQKESKYKTKNQEFQSFQETQNLIPGLATAD